MIEILAWAAAGLTLLPLIVGGLNLFLYRRLPAAGGGEIPAVSVLVPARNEEGTIGACLRSVLANTDVRLQVVVMDDHSEDRTSRIVERYAEDEPRLELYRAEPLPAGWNGKQHACAALARQARHPILLFLDADVELASDALGRIARAFTRRDLDLLSGVPRQRTGSFAERQIIPLIHFVLLGFLPLGLARRSRRPAFAAGCGQLLAVRRQVYDAAGGHAGIRHSRHDGLLLPRAVRRVGGRADIFDATDIASCRMYRNASEVWTGLTKNATEGLGEPRLIALWSALLLGGQVAPFGLLAASLLGLTPTLLAAASTGTAAALLFRLLLARRFGSDGSAIPGHPLAVLTLVAAQWVALGRAILGRPIAWKGRIEGARRREEVGTRTPGADAVSRPRPMS